MILCYFFFLNLPINYKDKLDELETLITFNNNDSILSYFKFNLYVIFLKSITPKLSKIIYTFFN